MKERQNQRYVSTSKKILVSLPVDVAEKLEKLCKENSLSRSALISKIIKNF